MRTAGVECNVRRLQIGNLKIEIHPSRKGAGTAAAEAAAAELKRLARQSERISVIFATGASQIETLRSLVRIPDLPWKDISGFHMDEYVGIPADHIGSFRYYMRQELTECVPIGHFHDVDGNAADPAAFCKEYAETLRSINPQLCLLGIGENGHLAFNDPGFADFDDPEDMKVVLLDEQCKRQQVAERWFRSTEEVPSQAMTLTIPTLLRVPKLIISVPGSRKAKIVYRALYDPISTACPATILRTHPDATVYLDEESAVELARTRN